MNAWTDHAYEVERNKLIPKALKEVEEFIGARPEEKGEREKYDKLHDLLFFQNNGQACQDKIRDRS